MTKKINLDKLNNLIRETGNLIAEDPIMATGEEMDTITSEFQQIYEGIGGGKKGILDVFKSWVQKTAPDVQYKSFENKIDRIFEQFDQAKTSIDTSVRIFTKYSSELKKEIDKISEYGTTTDTSEFSDDELMEYRTIGTILSNLQLSYGRIMMRLESGKKLARMMEFSRPAFQTLLSSVIIETSSQKALNSSVNIMKTLGGAIDTMSTRLTDDTIRTAHIALEAEVKPLLGAGVIKENAERLRTELLSINKEREQYLLEARAN